jgi:hypothetical protein
MWYITLSRDPNRTLELSLTNLPRQLTAISSYQISLVFTTADQKNRSGNVSSAFWLTLEKFKKLRAFCQKTHGVNPDK